MKTKTGKIRCVVINKNERMVALEYVAVADLVLRGFEVFGSVTPGCSCDLIIIDKELKNPIRVKVTGDETVSHKEGRYDVLAVVLPSYKVRYFSSDDRPIIVETCPPKPKKVKKGARTGRR